MNVETLKYCAKHGTICVVYNLAVTMAMALLPTRLGAGRVGGPAAATAAASAPVPVASSCCAFRTARLLAIATVAPLSFGPHRVRRNRGHRRPLGQHHNHIDQPVERLSHVTLTQVRRFRPGFNGEAHQLQLLEK